MVILYIRLSSGTAAVRADALLNAPTQPLESKHDMEGADGEVPIKQEPLNRPRPAPAARRRRR